MSSLLSPLVIKSKMYAPISWAEKLKFQFSKKSEPCKLRSMHAYVQGGGQFGAFKPWNWRDVAKHLAKLSKSTRRPDDAWHAMLIDLLSHQPHDGIAALSGYLIQEISRASTEAHEQWLVKLETMTKEKSYGLWYTVVINGLLQCKRLRQQGVLSCVAAIPAASMEQTLETVGALLDVARELGLSPARTQAMLDTYWYINPGTPFVNLTNYLETYSPGCSKDDYLKHIEHRWLAMLPYLDTPAA